MSRVKPPNRLPLSPISSGCARNLCPGAYKIEVIDLVQNPELAKADQIFALPTLVRRLPPPLKRIIGNLSNKEKFLVGMDIRVID